MPARSYSPDAATSASESPARRWPRFSPGFTGESTERLDEVRASAAVLGVHRVEHLGYADSGHGPIFYPDPPTRTRFARGLAVTRRGRYVGQKKRAMAAHRSQIAPAGLQRRLALLGLRLPPALFRPVVGREWFVEKGARRATWIF